MFDYSFWNFDFSIFPVDHRRVPLCLPWRRRSATRVSWKAYASPTTEYCRFVVLTWKRRRASTRRDLVPAKCRRISEKRRSLSDKRVKAATRASSVDALETREFRERTVRKRGVTRRKRVRHVAFVVRNAVPRRHEISSSNWRSVQHTRTHGPSRRTERKTHRPCRRLTHRARSVVRIVLSRGYVGLRSTPTAARSTTVRRLCRDDHAAFEFLPPTRSLSEACWKRLGRSRTRRQTNGDWNQGCARYLKKNTSISQRY